MLYYRSFRIVIGIFGVIVLAKSPVNVISNGSHVNYSLSNFQDNNYILNNCTNNEIRFDLAGYSTTKPMYIQKNSIILYSSTNVSININGEQNGLFQSNTFDFYDDNDVTINISIFEETSQDNIYNVYGQNNKINILESQSNSDHFYLLPSGKSNHMLYHCIGNDGICQYNTFELYNGQLTFFTGSDATVVLNNFNISNNASLIINATQATQLFRSTINASFASYLELNVCDFNLYYITQITCTAYMYNFKHIIKYTTVLGWRYIYQPQYNLLS